MHIVQGRSAQGWQVWVRFSLPESLSNTPIFWIGAMFGVMMVLVTPRMMR